MSLGFESAGFDVKAAVEYDPIHAATYKFNFPNFDGHMPKRIGHQWNPYPVGSFPAGRY